MLMASAQRGPAVWIILSRLVTFGHQDKVQHPHKVTTSIVPQPVNQVAIGVTTAARGPLFFVVMW